MIAPNRFAFCLLAALVLGACSPREGFRQFVAQPTARTPSNPYEIGTDERAELQQPWATAITHLQNGAEDLARRSNEPAETLARLAAVQTKPDIREVAAIYRKWVGMKSTMSDADLNVYQQRLEAKLLTVFQDDALRIVIETRADRERDAVPAREAAPVRSPRSVPELPQLDA